MTEPPFEMGTAHPLDDDITAEDLDFDDLGDDLDTESGASVRTIISAGAGLLVAALAVVGGIALSGEPSGTDRGTGALPADQLLTVTVTGAARTLHLKSCDKPATARFTATLVTERTPVEVSYRWVDNGTPGTGRQITLRKSRTTLTHKIAGTGAGRVQSTLEVLSPRVKTPAPAVIRVTCGTPAATSAPAPPPRPDTITVPALTGLSVEDATAALRERGLATQVSYVHGGHRDVVQKTSPSPGTAVAKGSTVVIVAGSGKSQATALTMPYVIDMTERQARAALKAAGWDGQLRIELVETQHRSKHGLVVEQHTPAGSDIAADDVIEIAIAQYLDHYPEPSETSNPFPREPREAE